MAGEIFSQSLETLGVPTWLLIITIIWSTIWKGFALWKSARIRQPIWFVVILVVNTLGILEILYLFLFSKMGLEKRNARKPVRRPVKKAVRKPARKARRKR